MSSYRGPGTGFIQINLFELYSKPLLYHLHFEHEEIEEQRERLSHLLKTTQLVEGGRGVGEELGFEQQKSNSKASTPNHGSPQRGQVLGKYFDGASVYINNFTKNVFHNSWVHVRYSK